MKKFASILLLFGFLFSSAQEKSAPLTSKEFQDKLNKEFADPKESPLTEEDLKSFKTLDFYPIDEKYKVVGGFVKANNEQVFKMKTTTDRLPEYIKYGEVYFKMDGKGFKLNIYQNIDLSKKKGFEDYLFLPFSDMTCGKESYLGGRYIDLRIPKDGTITIDFNTAYNPYCAYNHKYSCPIVPLENKVDLEIKAGVKKFHD